MSFDKVLERLQESTSTLYKGGNKYNITVRRQDLQELLHHFQRLDNEIRSQYLSRNTKGNEL